MVYAISSSSQDELQLGQAQAQAQAQADRRTELLDLIASTQRNVIRRTGRYQMGRMYPAGRSHARYLIGRSIYHIIPETVSSQYTSTPGTEQSVRRMVRT